MKISVIIPVYNVEAYLRECLDSVICQRHADWEAILIDDYGSDSSAEICSEYCRRDARFRLISHSQNRGLSAARNSGLDAAVGEALTFLDSDDTLHPDFLKILASLLGKEDIDIASAAITRRKEEMPDADIRNMKKPQIEEGREALREILYQTNPALNNSVSGKLYKTAVFKNLRFREGILYEDLDICPSIYLSIKKTAILDLPLYYYRPTPGSITNKFNRKRTDVLSVTQRIIREMPTEYPELRRAAADRSLSAAFNIFGLMAANDVEDEKTKQCCLAIIRRERRASLLDPHVRLKNKVGILASYLGGPRLLKMLSRRVYG